jgi:hypothetical protein
MDPEARNIDLGFFTYLDLRTEQLARSLLRLIYDQGKEFAPQVFEKRGRMFAAGTSDLDALAESWSKSDSFVMRREDRYESELAVTTLSLASRFNLFKLWVEEEYFESESRVDCFLSLSVAIYGLLRPAYGKIHQTRDAIESATVQDPRYGNTVVPIDLRKGLPGIYWANFFGPEYVELFGRRKLLAAACERVVDLPDGGLLLVTVPSPLDPWQAGSRTRQRVIRKYLGEDFFHHWGQSAPGKVPRFRYPKS